MVSACNRAAYDAVTRWPDWQQPVLVLQGPPAAGKTHLAHIWAARSGAHFLDAATLTRPAVQALAEEGGAARAWVLEGLEALAEQAALFHLLNAAREQGGWLLVTTATPPAQMEISLADLRSRLCAAPLATLDTPDDAALMAALVKQFADRQLRVGEEVVQYLLKRMERSFAAARDWVARIDAEALATRSNITVALVRRLLDADANAAAPPR